MTTEIWQLSESELLADAAAVSHRIQLLEARRIALVAEIDTRVSREKLGFPGPAGWLTSTTLLSPSKATRIVALARGMAAFPDIADAVNTGVMSVDHAALILTFAETPPENLPEEGRDAARAALIKSATGTRRAHRPDPSSDHQTRRQLRHQETTRREHRPQRTLRLHNPQRAAGTQRRLRCCHWRETAHCALPVDRTPPAADGSQDDRSPARRRADAFGHILDQYLASRDRPIEGGERPHLNLHIRLQDLTDLRDIADDITDDETSRAATESDTDTADPVDINTRRRPHRHEQSGSVVRVPPPPHAPLRLGSVHRHRPPPVWGHLPLAGARTTGNRRPVSRTQTITRPRRPPHRVSPRTDSSPAPRTRCGAGRDCSTGRLGWSKLVVGVQCRVQFDAGALPRHHLDSTRQ
ncbi:hypothetical protein CH256_02820 [Rhodococcus sp. 05-2254-6]|uniref:DUF222 domain-containing protein n=1 Tax=Rhodococcus sp. 05-2254-6 TaxID=2022489 RepID=UPI000B9B82EB|nr:DUF222 domain-containing protein [Rhodococcus sp. 05-2254-6]OZE43563.1 hypothetical protein CH256_02820 [Rhodococcus sp. 05-2254-6]